MKENIRISLAIALLATAVPAVSIAAIEAITSVETQRSGSARYALTSVTVGDYTVTADLLATGKSRGDTVWPTKITNADNLNLNSLASRLSADPVWTITMLGGQATWTDSNGNRPDFFLFETGMNDSLTVQAILVDGTAGQAVTVAESAWGDTGLDRVGIYNRDQSIGGIAFAITDLLDEDGFSLANDAVIKGIRITSRTLDPVSFSAVIPEPATVALLAIGGLLMRRRRRA